MVEVYIFPAWYSKDWPELTRPAKGKGTQLSSPGTQGMACPGEVSQGRGCTGIPALASRVWLGIGRPDVEDGAHLLLPCTLEIDQPRGGQWGKREHSFHILAAQGLHDPWEANHR